MFDISCLYGQNEFSTIQEDAYQFWDQLPCVDPFDPYIAQLVNQMWGIPVIGQHYFVNQGNNLVPVFDFSSTGQDNGNSSANFFGEKAEDVPSPDGPQNVVWLQINSVSGELASIVYRVYTVQGQPPATVSSSRPLDLLAMYNQRMFL